MTELEQQVLAAKTDERAFNELVESNQAWMLRVASEVTHRYVTDSDDEWSIALMAFSEAVQSYEEDKGSFRGLAAMVIRRRVVDYLRVEGRHSDELAVSPAAFEDSAIELTVNHFGRVIAVNALSDDTAALAKALTGEVRHKKPADALEHTMKRLREEGYLGEQDAAVVAGVTSDNAGRAAELKQSVERAVGEGTELYVSETSRDERRQAMDDHRSAGRFAFERDHGEEFAFELWGEHDKRDAEPPVPQDEAAQPGPPQGVQERPEPPRGEARMERGQGAVPGRESERPNQPDMTVTEAVSPPLSPAEQNQQRMDRP